MDLLTGDRVCVRGEGDIVFRVEAITERAAYCVPVAPRPGVTGGWESLDKVTPLNPVPPVSLSRS